MLTKCSPDTALRDTLNLVELGILNRNAAGGRSTSYELAASAHNQSAQKMARLPNTTVLETMINSAHGRALSPSARPT